MKRILLALCFACAISAYASSAVADAITTYRGICNASAGIDLGAGYFIVADDEINSLVIYRYDTPKHVGKVELNAYLNGPDGGKDEADLEGAARIGDTIYWIGSHGRNADDELKPKRHRLFATRIDLSGATPTVAMPNAKPYGGLLEALASDRRFSVLTEASEKGAEKPRGLNIEGLADTKDGGLYIGFRNPLSEANSSAHVLKLKNPDTVINRNAAPVFDDLILLDLGKRGIRSMERVGDEYFIVAGPIDDGKAGRPESRFAIYRWTGERSARPVYWKDIDPPDFHAEGLFAIAGTDRLYLLSDDGGKRSVCQAKSHEMSDDKTFRGMSLRY